MMSLKIRPAVLADASFIARAILEAVGIENAAEEILQRQTEMCSREDVLYSWRNSIVAEVDGHVVGSLTSYDGRHYRAMRSVTFPLIWEMCGADFTGMADETGPGEYYLDSLYVVSACRRRGIGTALIREGIARAQVLRLPVVSLLVSSEKPAAAQLYRELGFEERCRIFAFHEDYGKMSMSLTYSPLLEVCAASLSSARTAARAGAPRIELCQRLDLGGITPAHSDIETCVKELPLQTFVLIRPRGGDFCYSDEEFAVILDDIRFCKSVGAAGVVVGFLNEDGSIDEQKCRESIAAARPMQVTFHRAFDRCSDWPSALEQIIDCGFNRILTSGQLPTAEQGLENLKRIHQQAAGRIHILAGSGVKAENAARLVHEIPVNEVHGSCKIAGFESDEAEIRKTLAAICW